MNQPQVMEIIEQLKGKSLEEAKRVLEEHFDNVNMKYDTKEANASNKEWHVDLGFDMEDGRIQYTAWDLERAIDKVIEDFNEMAQFKLLEEKQTYDGNYLTITDWQTKETYTVKKWGWVLKIKYFYETEYMEEVGTREEKAFADSIIEICKDYIENNS